MCALLPRSVRRTRSCACACVCVCVCTARAMAMETCLLSLFSFYFLIFLFLFGFFSCAFGACVLLCAPHTLPYYTSRGRGAAWCARQLSCPRPRGSNNVVHPSGALCVEDKHRRHKGVRAPPPPEGKRRKRFLSCTSPSIGEVPLACVLALETRRMPFTHTRRTGEVERCTFCCVVLGPLHTLRGHRQELGGLASVFTLSLRACTVPLAVVGVCAARLLVVRWCAQYACCCRCSSFPLPSPPRSPNFTGADCSCRRRRLL